MLSTTSRSSSLTIMCLLAASLAGCNSTSTAVAPPVAAAAGSSGATPSTYASERFAPANFKLPEGAGCSGDVARFRAIMDNDWRSGNVGQSVYNQIIGEIDQAANACVAGRDGEARGLIHTSRSRHGYPAG